MFQASAVSIPLDRRSASDDATAKCITRVGASVAIPLWCKEESEGVEFSDDVLKTNLRSVLLTKASQLLGAVRGRANLCWARRDETSCNRWNSPEKEDDCEVLLFCFLLGFLNLRKIWSSVEISDGMTIGQSRHIAKVLKKLVKLDDQTANEITLLSDLYSN